MSMQLASVCDWDMALEHCMNSAVPCPSLPHAGKTKTVSRFNILFEGEREEGLEQLRAGAVEHQRRLRSQMQFNAARDSIPLEAAPLLPHRMQANIVERVGYNPTGRVPPSLSPAGAKQQHRKQQVQQQQQPLLPDLSASASVFNLLNKAGRRPPGVFEEGSYQLLDAGSSLNSLPLASSKANLSTQLLGQGPSQKSADLLGSQAIAAIVNQMAGPLQDKRSDPPVWGGKVIVGRAPGCGPEGVWSKAGVGWSGLGRSASPDPSVSQHQEEKALVMAPR